MELSIEIIFVPFIAGGIAGLAGVAGYAATELGYSRILDNALFGNNDLVHPKQTNQVDIKMDESSLLADSLSGDDEFTLQKDDIRATFKRDINGKCLVHVSSDIRSDAELEAAGRELVGKVTQRYAYNKVMVELRNRGFTVSSEEVAADQSIRIKVSKYV